MQKHYKITANVDDHQDYKGQHVTIISKLENDYYVMEDNFGNAWQVGMEELTECTPAERLEYLRGELQAETISYQEIAELQSLIPHIEKGDVELLEAAGVPEFPIEQCDKLLIAIFMELSINLHLVECPITGEYIEPENLKYDSSWDMLMPVVKAVDAFVWDDSSDDDQSGAYQLQEAILNLDMDDIYKAVVHSIKWYNSNQKFYLKCSVTGIGMNVGWFVLGEWYSTQELADKVAIEQGYKDFKSLYDDCSVDHNDEPISNDEAYWTSFESEDIDHICKQQGYYYTARGEQINF